MALYPQAAGGGNEPRHPDSRLTLREAFAKHYDQTELRKSSKALFDYALRFWEATTCNPPVGEIDDELLKEFREAARQKIAPKTVNGYWGSYRSILRRIGPRETGNPRGLNILPMVPYMRQVPVPRKMPVRVTQEELAKLYLGCRFARHPRRVGVPARDLWRCLIVLAYLVGLRKGDLFRLRFEDFNLHEGLLYVRAEKTEKDDFFPLHPVAVEHVRRIWTPRERVFQGFDQTSQAYCHRLDRIRKESGIERRITLHDLRRTGGSEAERIKTGFGPIFLQHAPRGVSEQFYLNRTDELREVIEAFRVPLAWKHGPAVTERVERKHREDQIRLRPEEFAFPEGPDPNDWKFAPSAFWFRGHWYALGSSKLSVLRQLATSATPVPLRELAANMESSARDRERSAQTRVATLRDRLRLLFGLADGWNPIPYVHANGECCYVLHLPPSAKPVLAPKEMPITLGPAAPPSSQFPTFGWLTCTMIRAARMRLGLTTRQVGEKVGVSNTCVWLWEQGKAPLYANHARKLIEVLGIEEPGDTKGGAA